MLFALLQNVSAVAKNLFAIQKSFFAPRENVLAPAKAFFAPAEISFAPAETFLAPARAAGLIPKKVLAVAKTVFAIPKRTLAGAKSFFAPADLLFARANSLFAPANRVASPRGAGVYQAGPGRAPARAGNQTEDSSTVRGFRFSWLRKSGRTPQKVAISGPPFGANEKIFYSKVDISYEGGFYNNTYKSHFCCNYMSEKALRSRLFRSGTTLAFLQRGTNPHDEDKLPAD